MPTSLKEAIAAASGRYPGNQWAFLDTAEQARAIYREMQLLDLEQAIADDAVAPPPAAGLPA